jgi:transposase-like protein
MKATLKICPECKSKNIVPYTWEGGYGYKCNDCGYTGQFVIETEINVKGEKIKIVPPKKLEK